MTDLTGKTVVTGGTRGVGRGTALAFARAGASVAVSYTAGQAAAAALIAEPDHVSTRNRVIRSDVAEPEQVRDLFARVHETLGQPDVVVPGARAGSWQRRHDHRCADRAGRVTIQALLRSDTIRALFR